ncbi:MAG: polysaccharide biosynthesis protein [bacterium]|nr:polysaccharide biosynthesis protein [bacterium]
MGSQGNSRRSNFIVQGGILATAGIISRLIGLLYRVPLTNIIGDEGNGLYAAAFQIYSIMLLISSYSLPLAVSKLVSSRVAKGQYRNARKIFRGALLFALISGGAVAVIVFFGADFFAGTLMTEPKSAVALRVLGPALLIVALMGVLRGYFQGMGTMMPTAISQILEQIVNAVMSILAATYLFQYGTKVAALLRDNSYAAAYGAAGGTLGTGAGALMGLFFLFLVLLSQNRVLKRQMNKDTGRYMESYGQIFRVLLLTILPVIMSAAIYNISDPLDQSIFNYIMTKNGMGDIQTSYWGMFSGKYRVLTNVPIALASSISASMMPTLTQCMEEREYRAAKHKVSTATRFTMILAIPCAVGLSVLGKPILSMLFTGEIDIPAKLLQIGSISVVFYSLSTLTNGILQGIDKMNIPVRNAAIALLIHLASLYVMLEYFNLKLYAVVFSCIIFAFTMCVLNGLSIKKHLHYTQEIKRTFVIPVIAAAVMGIVCWLMHLLFSLFLSIVPSTLLSIAIGALVYFAVLIALKGIKESELRNIPMGGGIVAIAKLFRLM